MIQRVSSASVTVGGEQVSSIGPGLCLLVGVEPEDTEADSSMVAAKVAGLRVFPDRQGKMNLSVGDVDGEVLVVSQFTLLGDLRRGRRPSFTGAAPPEAASPLIDHLVEILLSSGVPTVGGRFGAHMEVELTNDGPVTLLLDVRRGVVV